MMRGLFFQHGSLNRARAVHNARTPVSWGVSETQLWLKTIMVPSLWISTIGVYCQLNCVNYINFPIMKACWSFLLFFLDSALHHCNVSLGTNFEFMKVFQFKDYPRPRPDAKVLPSKTPGQCPGAYFKHQFFFFLHPDNKKKRLKNTRTNERKEEFSFVLLIF